ncbi:Necrosis-inducing secreted protein 1 [Pseudocercospora fuligena]|uniref:Necrosis-inducing secreted protein 1 n=1 Tax=Pseudocercospora fuligena TaxID=685502 RepID=A0A8H6RRM8_9PEZI|nr:Necrosis-inducing secreted protein 1 [Pseudocercospora fuligena]
MKPFTLLTTFATLASARITGFATPKVIAPDTTIKLLILTENFSQTVYDVAMSFGLSPTNTSYPGSLGDVMSSKFLGPDFSNIIENITHYVHIPATGLDKGENVTLTAAHFSLIGALRSPIATSYAVNITVGDITSSEYVRSELVPEQ